MLLWYREAEASSLGLVTAGAIVERDPFNEWAEEEIRDASHEDKEMRAVQVQ